MAFNRQLKFADFATLGQKIRAYSFFPRPGIECFYEGIVEDECFRTANGVATYVIRTTRSVWEGKDVPIEATEVTIVVPHELSFSDWDTRIVLVEEVAHVA
jgi:hypothetical protein